MFWRFNVINTQIDTLLEREDITLQEILDEDDVLQECKAQNPRLLEFLVKPENMDELVNWITSEPKEAAEESEAAAAAAESESEDNKKPALTLANLDVQAISDKLALYKLPNIACELLTSDCPQITEKLAGEEAYLNKIYSFLESEGVMNPLLASFFSKVMGLLIARKSELMLDFLKAREDCVSHLLRHIGTSAIMDLLLRLITCIESPETRLACVNWLNDQSIIQKLVALIDADHSEDKHCNASQSLCDIIRLSRDQMSQLQDKADPDPLLATVESTETVTSLLEHMFRGDAKVESVLINGLQVIQTLLEFRKAGYVSIMAEGCEEMMTALDRERLETGISNTLKAVIPRLKDFHHILQDPPKQHYQPMPTSLGSLEPPLGNTRLQTVKLVSSILLSNSRHANMQLANLHTLGILLDLFFKYSWNNFLHSQVEACLRTVFNTSPSSSVPEQPEDNSPTPENTLVNQLFSELKLIERILDTWEENEQNQTRPGGHRKGYMGHLTNIANRIVDSAEKGINAEIIKQLIKDLPEELQRRWETFVSGSLTDANKTNTLQMVGGNALHSSSDSEDPDFSNIHFPQESAMQSLVSFQARRKARLAFSDYQLHQMTSTFIDQFGFKEDEFTEQEQRVDAPFTDRISSISFEINSVESSNAAATLFEQACSERLQQFDEQDSDEDLWEEKEVTFNKASTRPSDSPLTSTAGSSVTPPRRRADAEQDNNSSDESTDSEEELNSPATIYQQPSSSDDTKGQATAGGAADSGEKMEVSENFANFDNFPVAMDTGSAAEDWAKFDELPSSSTTSKPEGGESWANFSNLEEMESSESALSKDEERSNSPVAMDTADTASGSNRMAQYMVSSSPGDAAAQTSSSSSEPASSPEADSTQPSSSADGHSSPPSTPREAWGSAPDTPRPSDDTPKVPAFPDTHTISSTTESREGAGEEAVSQSTPAADSATSSSHSNISSSAHASAQQSAANSQSEPISSTCSSEDPEAAVSPADASSAVESSPPTESSPAAESSPAVEISPAMESNPPEEASPPVESSAVTESKPATESSPAEGSCEADQSNEAEEKMESSTTPHENSAPDEFDDDDDDLNDNFNFLAASGLMGGRTEKAETAGAAAAPDTPSSSQQEEEVNSSAATDEQTRKLEQIRAEAREALEEFSTATSTSHNGPV